MDPSTFDELTKALATATSRRQALKALGAALGGALGFSSIGTAFAKCKDAGHPCSKNEHCCSKLCCHGKCCASGQVCQHGKCVTPTTTTTTTTPAPTTTTTTTTAPPLCSSGGDFCTEGVSCGSGGGCECTTDVDGSFVCVAIGIVCNGCTSDAECPANNVCVQAATGCCIGSGVTTGCAPLC